MGKLGTPRSDGASSVHLLSGYGLGRLRSAREDLLSQFCIGMSHDIWVPCRH